MSEARPENKNTYERIDYGSILVLQDHPSGIAAGNP